MFHFKRHGIMKAMKHNSFAVLVLAAAISWACTDELQLAVEPQAQNDNFITLVTTIYPKSGLETRSLTDPGNGTIKAAWQVGEELYMVYQDANDDYKEAKATVTKVDANGVATISVDLVNPKSCEFKIAYPYATYYYDPNADSKNIFMDQLGTLEDISTYYDMSDGLGNLVVDGNVASIPDGISLDRAVSIWKFTLSAGGSDITSSVTSLTLKMGDASYTVSPSGLSAIYVAFFPLENTTVTVTAVTPSGTYSKSKDGVTTVLGKLYVSEGLELEAAAPTTTFTYTATEKLTVFDDISKFTGATAVQSHSFTGNAGKVVYDGVVTAVEDGIFYYDQTARASLITITLPASLTAVSGWMFYNCKSLASVSFAPGTAVSSIGSHAFYQCSSLASIAIPAGVTTIEGDAFYGCKALESVTFPGTSSLTTIKSGVFWDCTNLQSIKLPESLTTIGWYQELDGKTYYNGSLFWNAGLTSLEIPKNLTTIYGGGHLGNCPLTSLTVNSQNPKYYSINGVNAVFEKNTDRLVMGCASTVVPDGTKAIGYEAFFGEELEFSLELPESVTAIEDRAFHMARGLKTINIPSGITHIDEETFLFAENVTDVYCAADPAKLTWDGFNWAFNMMEPKATKFHVDNVAAWEAKFPDANVTFVGEGGGEQSATYRVYTSGTQYSDIAIPNDAVTVTSSTTSWSAGTYVVSSDVTISGGVTLAGDVNLILCDGAELKITDGHIQTPMDEGNTWEYLYSLNIYGQSLGTGKLTVVDNDINIQAHNMNIHGGVITVTEGGVMQGIETDGVLNIYNGDINVNCGANGIICLGTGNIYGGTITAVASGSAAILATSGELTIAGGTINASCTGSSSGIEAAGNLTVTGGVVTATGGEGQTAILVYGTFTLGGSMVLYEGDSPNPATPAASQSACTKRYAIIK